MTRYILRRLLQAIPTLFGISIVSFIIIQAAPGDPVLMMTFDPRITEETREELRRQLGLDQPLLIQYLRWLERLVLHGDLGRSYITKRPVLDMILERVPATLLLTGTALFLGLVLGVPTGVYAAVRQRGVFDNLTRFFAVIGNAIPAFWLGLILILIFAVKLRWLPTGGMYTLTLDNKFDLLDRIKHLLLPALVLATGWVANLSRYMRTETLEVIRQDYIRTAYAKGLRAHTVWFVHAARNALIPLVTILGPALGGLLAGAVITERVFSWPGMGRLAIDAVFSRDYPVVMGNLIIASVLVVMGNLLSDVLYAVVDPRVRLE
ncbi:MAG: ABC transporter permease [Chloroflexi bacterium]|nr:ABC transporter permease [Chloroflexota bacterium]